MKFYWDPIIIPTFEYLYLNYENHFHFAQTVQEIYEEETRKICVGVYHVEVEHPRQEEILQFMAILNIGLFYGSFLFF